MSRWLKRSESDKKKIYHEQEMKGAVPTAKIQNPFNPRSIVPQHLREQAKAQFIQEFQYKVEPIPPERLEGVVKALREASDWKKQAQICFDKSEDIKRFLASSNTKDINPQIRQLLERSMNLWFRRCFIMKAFDATIKGSVIQYFGNERMDKMVTETVAGAFKALNINDLQICNCNNPKECESCKEIIPFLQGNFSFEETEKFLKGRAWPIDWYNIPEFAPFKEIQQKEIGEYTKDMLALVNKVEGGKCPMCGAPIYETDHGPHCEFCRNHIDFCVCKLGNYVGIVGTSNEGDKMEENLSKEELDALWKWIDRPLSPEFFTEKLSEGQIQERIDEIPIQYRKLAKLIYELALWHHKLGRDGITPYSCCEFRQLLFVLVKKSKDSYPLPYYWFVDGVMIEPEWIVRLTNGLVKWVCDSSKSTCGLYGRCIFSA